MVNEALDYIRREVRNHLGIPDSDVNIDNVHGLKDDTNLTGAFISLVNLQEEAALKNTEHHVRQNSQLRYKEPPVYLNLYVLFVFKFEDYAASLLRLSQTVELFQSKRFFTQQNESAGNPFPSALEKLVFDFHNLNFEQLNHLWGILGGAYFPSLVYKVRLVKVQLDQSVAGPEITTVQVDTALQ